MSEKRQVLRLKVENIDFADLKRGDIFILIDEGMVPIEDGSVINVARSDARDNCITCKPITVRDLSFMHLLIPPTRIKWSAQEKVAVMCSTCLQMPDPSVTGEHPCEECGMPQVHDDEPCPTCDGHQSSCPDCNPDPGRRRDPVPEGCEDCPGCSDCLEVTR